MNPQEIFCPNIDCPARGQRGEGNICIHSQKEKRYRCTVCAKTFSATKGSIFYRLRTDPALVMIVITLLAYGCPIQAIVAAYGFDPRTISKWWQRAGDCCESIHQHIVGQIQQDLGQVQADEIKVKTQGRSIWMALVMAVSSRLWLGGAVSPRRDKALIRELVAWVRQTALCRPLLVAVDGLPGYVNAIKAAFRTKCPRRPGEKGRCRLVAWPNIAIVQVVKRRTAGKLDIVRRIVQGKQELVERLIQRTQGRGGINTAYIERLNGTFRQHLAALARRTRHLARKAATLKAGMFVFGCIYNFCSDHASLRISLAKGEHGTQLVPRTPAMAAGLTDHRWTIAELFAFKVPPPRWTPPKKRGRPSQATLRLVERWC